MINKARDKDKRVKVSTEFKTCEDSMAGTDQK